MVREHKNKSTTSCNTTQHQQIKKHIHHKIFILWYILGKKFQFLSFIKFFILLIYNDSTNFLFAKSLFKFTILKFIKSILCSYLKQCLTDAVFLFNSFSFDL